MFRKKAGAWPVFLVLALLLSLLVLPAQAAEEAIGVTINGTPVTYDDGYGRPFVDAAGRTQVPFRLTMETFGCTVDWDNDTRTAMAEKDGTKVEVPVGRDYLIINGKRADIDTTAQLVDGRVYLPIRPVLEAFDASVTWNSKDHLVVVTTGSSLVRVYFLDVGQGDATLIDCGETEVLIDGGTNSAGKDVVAAIAPYIDGKLDYVIATHPDADHVGGLDAVLVQGGVNLSGGQRQRAAIARGLAMDPEFLIADEPVSSLDAPVQMEILRLLKQLRDRRNLTLLIISHDIPMVEHISDRIIRMEKEGPRDEFK